MIPKNEIVMESKNRIAEEQMAAKLRGHSVAPPPGVWTGIEDRLAGGSKKIGLVWLPDAGAMVLWLAMTVGFHTGMLGSSGLSHANGPVAASAVEAEVGEAVEAPIRQSDLSKSKKQTTGARKAEYTDGLVKSSYSSRNEAARTAELPREGNTASHSQLEASKSQRKIVADVPAMAEKLDSEELLIADAAMSSAKQMSAASAAVQTEKSAPSLMGRRPFSPIFSGESPLEEIVVDDMMAERNPFAKALRRHQFFLGIGGMANLVSIFNQNNRNAFGGRELPYKPTFGYAGYLRIGYRYRHRYGVETGFVFHSRQGQHYEGRINNAVATRQVDMTYMQVPLLLRYTFGKTFSNNMPSPWVIGIGAQFGFLTAASERFEGNEASFQGEFFPVEDYRAYLRPMEVAGVLAIDKEFYFHRNMFVSVGLRTTIGSDINAEGSPAPDDYGKSHNFTFGLNVSFNGFLER